MKNSHPFLFLFIVSSCLLWFTQCEKDDICVEGTPGTPRLVFDFYDVENPETLKDPGNFALTAVATSTTIELGSGPYTLPLRNDQDFTQFTLTLNPGQEDENQDLTQIQYLREDLYINRACGFRAVYTLNPNALVHLDDPEPWIKGFYIIETTVTDETVVHLALLH